MISIGKRVKLSVWAKRHGLTPRSTRQTLSFGTLPAELDPVKIGRHRFVREVDGERLRTVLYARVSSADQRADLDRQKLRLLEYAQKHGLQVDDVIAEVGSGLNGSRRELLAALSRPGLGVVAVGVASATGRRVLERTPSVRPLPDRPDGPGDVAQVGLPMAAPVHGVPEGASGRMVVEVVKVPRIATVSGGRWPAAS